MVGTTFYEFRWADNPDTSKMLLSPLVGTTFYEFQWAVNPVTSRPRFSQNVAPALGGNKILRISSRPESRLLNTSLSQKSCSHQWWEQHFANFNELTILLRQDLDFNKMLFLPSVGTTFCESPVDRNPVWTRPRFLNNRAPTTGESNIFWNCDTLPGLFREDIDLSKCRSHQW